MLEFNFSPFPTIETERLLLRRITNDDANEILELRSNPETMKYIPRPLVKNTEDALAHIAMIEEKIETNIGINWAITLKESRRLLGIIGFYRKVADGRREFRLPFFFGKIHNRKSDPHGNFYPCKCTKRREIQFGHHRLSRPRIVACLSEMDGQSETGRTL